MYGEVDDASDVDEDFFNALALLHSNENDSAEKLRKMLDVSIRRKYGSNKTLAVRMPWKYSQNSRILDRSSAIEASNEHDNVAVAKKPQKFENPPYVACMDNENSAELVSIFDVGYEDYTEKGDIPRISIPDEGSSDGLLCKICNGAKLGPLILLECQECQEVYHPLCHQPPVVDIDVYDPRIVWRCRTCVDTSPEISLSHGSDGKTNRSQLSEDGPKKNVSTQSDRPRSIDTSTKKLETMNDKELIDFMQVCNSTVCQARSTNDVENVAQKGRKIAASNQLRKRIGSKLSVSRSVRK